MFEFSKEQLRAALNYLRNYDTDQFLTDLEVALINKHIDVTTSSGLKLLDHRGRQEVEGYLISIQSTPDGYLAKTTGIDDNGEIEFNRFGARVVFHIVQDKKPDGDETNTEEKQYEVRSKNRYAQLVISPEHHRSIMGLLLQFQVVKTEALAASHPIKKPLKAGELVYHYDYDSRQTTLLPLKIYRVEEQYPNYVSDQNDVFGDVVVLDIESGKRTLVDSNSVMTYAEMLEGPENSIGMKIPEPSVEVLGEFLYTLMDFR